MLARSIAGTLDALCSAHSPAAVYALDGQPVSASCEFCPYPIAMHIQHYADKLLLLLLLAAAAISSTGTVLWCVVAACLSELRDLLRCLLLLLRLLLLLVYLLYLLLLVRLLACRFVL
jgi:hypothetical protein